MPTRFGTPYNKIITEKTALEIIKRWKKEGKRIVFVDAVLDLPHYRHPEYFLKCANLGDKLVVRIPSDELIKVKKDPRGPIVSWENRAKHAAHYPYIDLIIPKNDFEAEWLYMFRPDSVVRSVTSSEILDEAKKLIPIYKSLKVKLVIMDEFAHVIPNKELEDQTLDYIKK